MSRLIGAVFVIWSATAAAGPSGRVVRVKHTGGNATVAPRLCVIHGDSGMCLGDQPEPGQTVNVLDEQHVVAEVQIVEATSSGVNCPSLWMVKTHVIRGAATDNDGLGVIDPRLDPSRAHMLDKTHVPASPSGLPGDEVWQAIDRDGNGTADILITRNTCDPSGQPTTGGPTSCIDVWARIGSKMNRTTHFAQCNP